MAAVSPDSSGRTKLEPAVGIEPTTCALRVRRSTIELRRRKNPEPNSQLAYIVSITRCNRYVNEPNCLTRNSVSAVFPGYAFQPAVWL
jgi:hypothetical protein